MIHNIETINQWFRRRGEQILRWRWIVIGTILILDILAVIGLGKLQFQVLIEDWFLQDDPLTIAKQEFKTVFGNQDYVGILVEANDVFAPEILHIMRELSADLEMQVPYADEARSLVNFEFTRGTEDGVEIFNIVPDPVPTDPEDIEAIRQLAFSKSFLINRLFSDDSRQAWISLRLHPYSEHDASIEKDPTVEVGEKVLEILDDEKYRQYTLRPAGTPALAYQEITFFNHEAGRLVMLSILIALLVLFLALRSIHGVIIPVVTFVSSLLWAFGGMGYLGIKVPNALMTLPVYLGVAVSIGYSIHVFNFFQRAFTQHGDRWAAVLYAVEETGWPIFFTAATTFGALLSFMFVPIVQVQWMGFSSAAVIASTYLHIMLLLPPLLSLGKNRNVAHVSQAQALRQTLNRFDGWLTRQFLLFSRWILTHDRSIMIGFLSIMALFSLGLARVYVSTDYEKAYGLKIPYVDELYYIGHTKVGSMYAYDITLTFDTPDMAKSPEALYNLDILAQEIQEFSLVTRITSLVDLIKDLNQVMHDDDPTYYVIPDSQDLIAQLLLLYEVSDGSEHEQWVDYDYTTLRMTVEVAAFDSAEVERELGSVRQRAGELFPDAKLGMVGTLMQLSVMQNYIARGEIMSFMAALVVICILMMLVFQSLRTGLIGMIPNLAPTIVIFGMMGYLDIPLDMTTMLIVPILLGLAVDDTIHVINHTKLLFQRSGNYAASIEYTFQTVGKAIFMTSFILIASFSAYLTSIMAGFVHLATLMTVGVLTALLADYFITPVLVKWTQPFGPDRPNG